VCVSIVNADNQCWVAACIAPLFVLLLALVGFLRHVQFHLPEMCLEKPGKALYSSVRRLRVRVSMRVLMRACLSRNYVECKWSLAIETSGMFDTHVSRMLDSCQSP
jgi:hypothetical protein